MKHSRLYFIDHIEVGTARVQLKVYLENRKDVRFSIGRRAAYCRLPAMLSKKQVEEQIEKCRRWVKVTLEEKNALLTHYDSNQYKDGDILQVGKRKYILHFAERPSTVYRAKLRKGHIYIELSSHDKDPMSRDKAIRHLLSRIVAKDFYPEIAARVKQLNALHFNKPINRISLKYNLSNWGSCSKKGNINLSTCLLFAPPKVIDYVIIHELAHLIEMNHSHRFWALVERAMPDYQEQIAWLKANWAHCNF